MENVEASMGKEDPFIKGIIEEYLKYGSVEEVYRVHKYNLPISYPDFQRKVAKWGIIKSAGPNSKLSEAICILTSLSEEKIPLERYYRKLPPSIKTSLSTMHRILHCVKEEIVRRVGTALVVTIGGDPNNILIGEDVSTPRLELGKPYGAISLPMGYSKKDECARESILRILQREVFTNETLNKRFPSEVALIHPKPFMFIDIVDVRVAVYNLTLPEAFAEVRRFSSFKLRNYTFIPFYELANRLGDENIRSGIPEIAAGYEKFLEAKVELPFFIKSVVNQKLSAYALEAVV